MNQNKLKCEVHEKLYRHPMRRPLGWKALGHSWWIPLKKLKEDAEGAEVH